MEDNILDSRYKIISSLGKGGFGKTYLAEDTKRPNNPPCVVKQLNPGIDDPKFLDIARRLFTKEAETLEKLGFYEQIPRLLAYFEEKHEFYLVQEYIEGKTLSQELSPNQPWSEVKVIDLLRDCLKIIDFVHSNGVIHRDIKPDNLIRRQDNKLVLVDFGTVKETVISQTQAIASTVAVGTRGYMPTEQARGKPRFTSDIYALGIIAIQALTGVHPIQLQEDQNGEILWQSQVRCSPKLKEIIAKMVRYHFKDRYQSAKEVLEQLAVSEQNMAEIPATQAFQYTPTEEIEPPTSSNNFTSTNNAVANSFPSNSAPVEQSEFSNPNLQSSTSSFNLSAREAMSSSQQNSPQPSPPPSNKTETNSSSQLMSFLKSPTAITVGIALLVGAIATGGMYFFSSDSVRKQQDKINTRIEKIKAFHAAKNYEKCSELSTNKETKEMGVPQNTINKWIGQCELGKAQKEADTDEYANAINIAIKVSEEEFPNYREVRQKIDAWSEKVLEEATEAYVKEGNLKEAKKMIVNVIPESSAIKVKALDFKAAWEEENETNEPIIEAAQKALREKRWQGAKIEADKIPDNSSEYWKQKAQDIINEANKEIPSAPPQPEREDNPSSPIDLCKDAPELAPKSCN
ncbi:MAG: serine/threonine-protein kinase [Xenococcaceae cyanobacterium MO_188.B29]|nr:serine/threonine-protein kinase [Xenococcaceae cyanobacterium MO_188.B29]